MSFQLHPQLEKDTIFIHDLELSKLLLMKDANFKWFILVPKIANIREIIDLNKRCRTKLFKEICDLSDLLKQTFKPYKLNIANIGNMVEQLHIHIILRYKDDLLYPKPIWGNNLPKKEYLDTEIEFITKLINGKLS